MPSPTRRHIIGAAAAATAASALAVLRPISVSADTGATKHIVKITGFSFEPAELTVAPGDSVTWTNRDIAPHTATAFDGSWDTGTLEKDQSATLVINEDFAGEYFCVHHPTMKAEITVRDS
ncbi:MAG: cupredoxin domain-containing protein [Pseudomonadota bacterium]